uniref:Nuclear pore complex protein Nup85 n=1 Tax=Parascaris univalens TaxID=6257 RepID=A0A914ZTA6_PARUN
MDEKPEELYGAWDASANGIVIALSKIKEGKRKDGLVKGELLRVVSLKDAEKKSFTSPAIQTLINESHTIFSSSQKVAKRVTMRADDLRFLSLEYRSALRSALCSLGEEDSELRETIGLYELIWSLTEAIFINSHVSSIVIDVIMWARTCLARTKYADEVSECLRRNKMQQLSEEHFWTQVAYFVLGGLLSNATAFLESYASLTNDAAIGELAKLISNVDMTLLNDPNTQTEFVNRQKELCALCDSGRLWGKGEAEKIARVVSGDSTALKRISCLVDSWFELMPAYLLFLRPRAAPSDLHEIVQECMNMCGSECEGSVDKVICALFSLDSLYALQLICASSPDWWLGAHLADLLYKCDPRTTSAHGIDARQFILMEYAKSLFPEPGMWRVAVDYLMECGEEGRGNLMLLIGTVPVENERTAILLSEICVKTSLGVLAADIARTITYKLLREERWASALSWAMRSDDPSLYSMVANQVIKRCSPEAVLTLDVLSRLSTEMVVSPPLLFLHKYYLFRNSLMNGSKVDAAMLLVDLIISDLVPRNFRDVLYTDLISILNDENEVLIEKEATTNMLRYLNRDDIERRNQAESIDNSTDDWKKKIEMLRFALLKNLVNTISS